MDTLLELGMIRRVHATGVMDHFDGRTSRHHHLVCTRCHKIVDIDDEGLDRLSLPNGKLQGFEVDGFSVHLLGACADCREEKRRGIAGR